MLRAHRDPEQPADTGHPKAPQAGADPEKTAKLSGEDGGTEEMLRLQQQVAGLREQLRGQEARWSAALRDLQAQLDALKKQNAGRRDGRRPSELRGPEARRSAASPQPRTRSDTLVLKGSRVSVEVASSPGWCFLGGHCGVSPPRREGSYLCVTPFPISDSNHWPDGGAHGGTRVWPPTPAAANTRLHGWARAGIPASSGRGHDRPHGHGHFWSHGC
uniref:T-complex 10 like n=1 Tax=Molossus molossus TaxID=27622 RepID=A0A7J8GUV3_MOLMO|nr:t-complex 10 like [Molossus molossus]